MYVAFCHSYSCVFALKYTKTSDMKGKHMPLKSIKVSVISSNNGAKTEQLLNMSLVMRKPAFCICKNKDADQLRGNREADQRLCFRYIDSTIPLLPIYEISSL